MASNRPTYLNEGWTPRGIARKEWAVDNNKCAYCTKPLPKGRRIYCSRNCSWKFLDDPRYHRRLLLWTRIRAEVLWENKICEICGVRPSSEVDHIKEIALGGDPFDKTNLQALCSLCHRQKTIHFLSDQMRREGISKQSAGERERKNRLREGNLVVALRRDGAPNSQRLRLKT